MTERPNSPQTDDPASTASHPEAVTPKSWHVQDLAGPVWRLIDFTPSSYRMLAIVRIYVAVVGLIYALRLFPLRHLRLDLSDPLLNFQYLTCHTLWLVTLVMMVFGYGGKLRNGLHFLAALLVLDPPRQLVMGSTVQESLYLQLAFFLIFVPTDRCLQFNFRRDGKPRWSRTEDAPKPIDGLGVYLFIVNFGFILFSAGIFKAWDPLWEEGIGFAATFNLTWIRVPWIPDMPPTSGLSQFMNYGALVMEMGYLFTLIFRRTRILSLLMLLPFFLSLIFPLRIDMIGWIGAGFILLQASISLPRAPESQSSEKQLQLLAGIPAAFIIFSVLLTFSITFKVWDYTQNDYAKRQFLPRLKDARVDAYRQTSSYRVATGSAGFLETAFQVLQLETFNRYCLRQGAAKLFTKRHTVGIFTFRVLVHDQAGQTHEPIRIFNPDMTGEQTTDLFAVRNLQANMYWISDIAHNASMRYRDPFPINLTRKNFLGRLLRHVEAAVPEEIEPERMEVLIRPIPINLEICGKPSIEARDWETLATWEKDRDKIRIHQVTPVPVQCRVTGLANYWVTPHPNVN